jgi:hypothetical protein
LPKPSRLTIPNERLDDVRSLIGLEVNALDAIRDVLASRERLRRDVPVQLLLADATGLTNAEAFRVFSAITNLARQKEAYQLTDDQILQDLRVIGGSEIEFNEHKIERLLDLIRKVDDEYFYEKVESLRGAFLPHMISARTVCDVRPIFNEKRDKVDAGLIVTYLDMRVHSTTGEFDSITVSLTLKDLHELASVIDTTLKKIELIKSGFGQNIELFD